jgi:threonine/homoserine/homoserine lactone efflux protein
MASELIGFLVVAGLLVVTPGADTMLVLGRAFRRGRRDALRAGCGVVAGLVVWATSSAAGLAALVTASRTGYDVLRLAGAGYLIWLGATYLRRALRQDMPELHERGASSRPFLAGFTTNLLNPKVGVFYLSVLPQLTPDGSALAPLTIGGATAHIAMSWCWLSVLAMVGGRVGDRLSPAFRRALEATSGGLLVAFGTRVAVTRR